MGWIKGNKKGRNLYLYKKYKVQKEIEKEPEIKKRKYEKEISKGIRTIAVTELRKGLGCSHMCQALESYLNNSCIVLAETELDDYFDSEYQTLILDLGDYNTLSKVQEMELKRADKQILMCCNDARYLEDLAEFVQLVETERYSFCFNFVPKENWSEIYDTMEGYDTYCLPIFDPFKIERKMEQILKKII